MANNDNEHEDYDRLTSAIARVLGPVMICMLLSVWLVNSLGDGSPCKYVTGAPGTGAQITPLPPRRVPPNETERKDPGLAERGVPVHWTRIHTIVFICAFCVLIVGFTYLLVFLVKRGKTRFIAGWLFVAVFLIFAYVGGIYIFEFSRSRCIPLDWITLTFVVWNFTITGIISVFAAVPRLINQAYLIVLSALMAYIFRSLPNYATWIILGILVVWDLFAVLTPWGPLKALVQHAKERGENLPALVYDTNPHSVGRDKEATVAISLKPKQARDPQPAEESTPAPDGETVSPDAETEEKPVRRRLRRRRKKDAGSSADAEANNAVVDEINENEGPTEEAAPGAAMNSTGGEGASGGTTTDTRTKDQKAVGTLGAHLKLGLGDFVFYSILVATASTDSAMTAITSFVAILAGLCITLFLVLVYRKALPALPISIVLGMIFYFLTKYTVQPFVEAMFVERRFH